MRIKKNVDEYENLPPMDKIEACIYYHPDTNFNYILSPVTDCKMAEMRQDNKDTSGNPLYWAFEGNRLIVHPKPTVDAELVIHYILRHIY